MDILNGIVRIESSDIGTGFVISADGLIITCAHVLGSPRPATASVIFQATGEKREAEVLAEGWRADDAEDTAVLRVTGALPEGVQPLPLGSSQATKGHAMITFGYPEMGEVKGGRAAGTILGRGDETTGGQPLLQLDSGGITRGFSGAPVWDEVRQRVVGMVVIAAVMDKQGKLRETAFATPAETLCDVYPTLQVSDLCPYRGIEAFTEEDASFFRGRGRFVDELVAGLRREPRFLAVFGPSGCGKSSLVQAGLIPRLRAGAIPGSDRWAIRVTRPTDPAFGDILTGLNQHSPPTAVVIDQFEELFATVSDTARLKVITDLTRLLEKTPSITLVIVMRNAYCNRLAEQEPLMSWLTRGSVNNPFNVRRDELISIAKEPASPVGMSFQEGLAEAMVTDVLANAIKEGRDVGSSGVLPLFELVLTQLWEQHQEGILTHRAYEQMGGVTGSLTQWADQIYGRFEAWQRPLVRSLFTALVHLGDEAQHIPDTRRRRDLASLVRNEEEWAGVFEVVQQLVAARLLVMSQDIESKQETIEIIHDALLREWGKLKQWIEEDRGFLLWHQELEWRVRAWIATNSDDPTKRDVYKLLGGSDLTEALYWIELRAQDLSQSERDFIQASKEQQHKRYTRRTVLAGLAVAGLVVGLTGSGIALSTLLRKPTLPLPGVPYVLFGHIGVVECVAWSPDSKRLASGSDDTTVQVWDAASGSRLLFIQGRMAQ